MSIVKERENGSKREARQRVQLDCVEGSSPASLDGAAPHYHFCSSHPIYLAVLSLSHREDIWFDDVDPDDIEAAIGPEAAMLVRKRLGQSQSTISLVKEQAFGG